MEFRVLRYFLTVAREESITKAAKVLHVTQPTLSRQLAQLKKDTGVVLFRRGARRIELTPEGILLRRRALEIVELVDKTGRELLEQEEEVGGLVSIGAGEPTSVGLLGDIIKSCHEKYPRIRFQIFTAGADAALERMGLDYIDMMLLRHPGSGDVEAYKAMEQARAAGKLRTIGLSNWYIEELNEFLPQISVMPALVQNEIHPYYQERDVVPFIQSKGIAVQCWYPLGGRGHRRQVPADATLNEIAAAHGVTAAQVILQWRLQRGIIVIPGSSNPSHIREKLDIFGFALSDAEIDRIAALDRGEKYSCY